MARLDFGTAVLYHNFWRVVVTLSLMEDNLAELDKSNILSSLPEKTRNLISNTVAALLIMMLVMLVAVSYRSIASRYSGVSETEFIMNTTFEIKVNGKNSGEQIKAAFARIREIAGQLNYYDEKSEISAINNMAGISPVAVSRDTFEIIDRAMKYSYRTSGAYDLTIGPLVDIWRPYFRDKTAVPSGNELVYAQHLVNYGNVLISAQNETVKLLYPGMKIDLGGAGKGYAIAKARTLLVDKGVKSAMISCGSSLTVIGDNKGVPWKVGVKHPRHVDELIGTLVLIPGQAVSTSGDYEKYFELNGKRYSHILNPGTGMPADDVMSVTIVCNDATDADILSTAVFVMGANKGMEFINSQKDTFAVIVDKDGKIEISPGLAIER
jgi:thiamine biosynthesis lipoprotein